MAADAVPGELLERLQVLGDEVDALADPRARELAQELAATIVAMYGDGLRRIIAAIEDAREAGEGILAALAQDGAVGSLLLIHDLYPVTLEDRVLEALDTVRPYMESHGGDVRLLGLEGGVARLALQGSCHGCAASRATLELAIKQALDEHAPDLAGLEVEGVVEPPPILELPIIQSPPTSRRWVTLDGAVPLPGLGELRERDVDGAGLVLANVGGTLLAYRDTCPACGGALHGGELHDGTLRCPGCAAEFDLPRAGRSPQAELQLEPVPLLAPRDGEEADGAVRVAV